MSWHGRLQMKLDDVAALPADHLNAMPRQQYKAVENLVRRAARRQGVTLEKSRRRDPRATDYRTYCLLDCEQNSVVASFRSSDSSPGLLEVAKFLAWR